MARNFRPATTVQFLSEADYPVKRGSSARPDTNAATDNDPTGSDRDLPPKERRSRNGSRMWRRGSSGGPRR